MDKLVEFFRTRGDKLGRVGDTHGWSPEDTAIYFLTLYVQRLEKHEAQQLRAQANHHDELSRTLRVRANHLDGVNNGVAPE